MPIVINLDVMLARRKMRLTDLSEQVGITIANLSNLKTGKARAVRFSTLEAICIALDCQPGDILEYLPADPTGSRGPLHGTSVGPSTEALRSLRDAPSGSPTPPTARRAD